MANLYNKSFNIKNRIKNAKDIYNVFDNLEKQGYVIGYETDERKNKVARILSIKDNVHVTVVYEDNREDTTGFKQFVKCIYY